MIRSRGLHFTLERDGAEELDLAVTAFTHTEQLSTPFTLDVSFASRHHDLDPTDFLDRGMTLTVWRDGEALRRVHGIVAEFGRRCCAWWAWRASLSYGWETQGTFSLARGELPLGRLVLPRHD